MNIHYDAAVVDDYGNRRLRLLPAERPPRVFASKGDVPCLSRRGRCNNQPPHHALKQIAGKPNDINNFILNISCMINLIIDLTSNKILTNNQHQRQSSLRPRTTLRLD
jgi:hypothetical protein